MKKFNQVEDKMINELAVAYVGGSVEAGEEFMSLVEPKLRNYARRQYSGVELEDLTQEFLLVAVKMCHKFVEKYNDGQNNILGLIYKKCKQRLIDLGRSDLAEMRSSRMVVGYDEDGEAIYENREISLQTPMGEDGGSTMADTVSGDFRQVEETVFDSFVKSELSEAVESFASVSKGRNAAIMPLIYKGTVEGWTNEEIETEIAKVLFFEKGVHPKPEAIRKAKSRALKAMREAIESGKVEFNWER